MSHPAKLAVDVASIGTVVSTIAGWLPELAALFSILWTGIRIYETRSVQTAIGRAQPGRRPECKVCTIRAGAEQ